MHLHRDLAEVRIYLSSDEQGRVSFFAMGEDREGQTSWLFDGECGPFDTRLDLGVTLARRLVHSGAIHVR